MTWQLDYLHSSLKNGHFVTQTWRNAKGKQFALAGISLAEYCKAKPLDKDAAEILAILNSSEVLGRMGL